MEPVLRYCTSADGTRIAFMTYGSMGAVPVLVCSNWAFRLQMSWQSHAGRVFNEGIAFDGLVTTDRRGTGDSQREIAELSLEAEVSDLEAVSDQAGLQQFDLVAFTALPALGYAVQHPARVRRLVLHTPVFAPRYGNLIEITRTDWNIARRALGSVLFPEGPTELQRMFSNNARDSVSGDVAAR